MAANYEDTEGRWKQEVERRLRVMETAQRAAFTSIADDDGNELVRLSRTGLEIFDSTTGERIVAITSSGVKVYDETGLTRALLGRISSGNYGAQIFDAAAGMRFSVENDGYHDPWLPHPMIKASAYETTTSATFVPIFQGKVELVTHEGVSISVVVNTDAATTGEFRLKNTANGTTTSAVSVPALGSVAQTFQWLHGTPLGTGPVRFDLEARRTGGAGNVTVFQPYTLAMADPLQCTATGL